MNPKSDYPTNINLFKAAITKERRKAILRIVPRQLLEKAIDTYRISLSQTTRKQCEAIALEQWETIEDEIFEWLNRAKEENS